MSQARPTALLSAAISARETRSEPEAIPTSCSSEQLVKGKKACLPSPAFVKKLCSNVYPEVALAMYAKGTPWKRVWMAGDVEAWNASGGLTHRTQLAFDEEVLVLARHSSGGIVVTGAAASYDVLRWDGTCVSIMEGELATRRPPAPRTAALPWSRLDEPTRHALLASPKVATTHAALDRTCGAADTNACMKANRAFAKAVADFVRGGGSLPLPSRRP